MTTTVSDRPIPARVTRSPLRRVTARLLVVALVAASLALGVVVSTPHGTARADLGFSRGAAGPLGAVSILGDSVLEGSGLTNPTLPDHLASLGWGPIRFQSTLGMSSGHFNVPWGAKVSAWINLWRSQGWDAPTVIVNVGANDLGLCQGSYQCAYDSVMHVVNTIGPGHRIWWPKATAVPKHQGLATVWNSALAKVASERVDVTTWEWPTVMATEGYRSHDNIHLDPAGYRKRSARMAQQITADIAQAHHTGGDAALPAPGAAPSQYVPLAPERVIDTRDDPPGRRGARTAMRVDFGDRLPAGATAVAVSVTAADPGASGYLTAYTCGAAPTGSTVNYTAGRSRGAMTITPLDASKDICVYAHTATDIVVDLQGAFVPPGGAVAGAGFQPRAKPERLVDTRQTGRSKVLTVATPPGVDAVAINLTAVNAGARGFVRAYPCDDASTEVSNVNFGPGEAVAGGAFVPTSSDDTVCLVANKPVDLVVDITGTFTQGSGLSFVPTPPTRMLDTRDGTGGWSPIQGTKQTVDVRVAPPTAKAVTGTIAMIRPFVRGFLTAHGCGTLPVTSSVNSTPGIVLANSITTGISNTGRLCVYSSRTSNVIFDTTGWWVA
jgi:hypothetical protein